MNSEMMAGGVYSEISTTELGLPKSVDVTVHCNKPRTVDRVYNANRGRPLT